MNFDPQVSSGIVSFSLRLVVGLLCSGILLHAQSIRVFSEFARNAESLPPAREIISPAVARNAFASFRIMVSAPPDTTFFLFVGANPPGIVTTHLYRENGAFLDQVRTPGFGVVPAGRSQREYMLDVWVPRSAEPGRRVRIELQLKLAAWEIYPMELRLQNAIVPDLPPALVLTLTDLLQRNAAQDLALLLKTESPQPWFAVLRQNTPRWMGEGPEWVLRLRDLLYRAK